MDIIICVERVSGCVERECDGRFRSRKVRIQVSRRILDEFKEGVWRRRRGVGKGNGAKSYVTLNTNNFLFYF